MSDVTRTSPTESAAAQQAVRLLLRQAKQLAAEYYRLTGKPLGVTGEVAEYEAAEKLGLTLADARTPFFDAFHDAAGVRERFQIKGRAVLPTNRCKARVPRIKCEGDFEAVLLVLLDKSTFEAIEIWRAERDAVREGLVAPGSRSRNERGAMCISQTVRGARRVWPPATI
ncbi:MAG: hypothetical protein WD207_10560 [Xanthobacteraceae bacterium]